MLSICSRVAFSRTAASAAEMLGTGKRETDGKEVVRSFRLRHSHDHLNDWGLSICRACFWLRSVGWFWKCLLGYRRSTRGKKKENMPNRACAPDADRPFGAEQEKESGARTNSMPHAHNPR